MKMTGMLEPEWCSQRLFEEEEFRGEVWDPCCGWGRIVRSALDAGYLVKASDMRIVIAVTPPSTS